MYPEEFAMPVKQKVLAQWKGYAYDRECEQLLLLRVYNAFLWSSFCLEAFASFLLHTAQWFDSILNSVTQYGWQLILVT